MFTWGPYRSGPPGDPLRSSRLLVLHFDGANGSTTFTDSSTHAYSVNREETVFAISTTQSKFGGASLLGADDDRLTVSMDSNWTGRNWNVKCFVRPIATPYNRFGIFYFGPNLIGRIDGESADGSYKFRFILSGATALESTAAIPSSTWTHLCISCEEIDGTDSQIRLFVDGNMDDDATSSDTNLALPETGTYSIGRFDLAGFRSVPGFMDEYIVTAATEHTASFTPQTSALPDF